jgi:hypothetical protein
VLGVRAWKHVVVSKLGWMTSKDADAALDRDPGS